MNPTVQIRPMQASDLEQVAAMSAGLASAPHWPFSAYRNALEPESRPRRICLVACSEQEKLLGFAMASILPPECELELIAVSPGSQRQGIGRRLFSALKSGLQAARAEKMLLEVRASNGAARGLYREAGMEETGRRRHYYVDPVEDAILMKLRLG